MKYTLQINTGSFDILKVYDINDVLDRLNYAFSVIDVDRVILGWNNCVDINKTIIDLCAKNNTEVFLWLPVFADVRRIDKSDKLVFLNENNDSSISVVEGENFEFICPNSEANIDEVIETYKYLSTQCHFDGVFLDRIRYASMANGFDSLLGCYCDKCLDVYKNNNINIDNLKTKTIEDFIPCGMNNGLYDFADEDINKLFTIKRNIVLDSVNELIDRFHALDLKVGLDVFAPAISDYVGQDVSSLAKKADFVKPMMYSVTNAPAGIPFELNALGEDIKNKINELWGCDISSPEGFIKQIENLKGNIVPGVEVNKLDICNASEEYLEQCIKTGVSLGLKGMVLSWDSLHADKTMFEVAGKYNG